MSNGVKIRIGATLCMLIIGLACTVYVNEASVIADDRSLAVEGMTAGAIATELSTDSVNSNPIEPSWVDGAPAADTSIKQDLIQQAIDTGNALLVPDSQSFVLAALDEIDATRIARKTVINEVFNLTEGGFKKADGSSLTDITWDLTHGTRRFVVPSGRNIELLRTSSQTTAGQASNGNVVAIAGQRSRDKGGSRYVAFASNPVHQPPEAYSDFNQFLKSTFSWLIQSSDLSAGGLNIEVLYAGQSIHVGDTQTIRTWLDREYGPRLIHSACNNDQLTRCSSKAPSVLVISDHIQSENINNVIAQVENAFNANIPVLYFATEESQNEFADKLTALMNISHLANNQTRGERVENFNPITELGEHQGLEAIMRPLLLHFRDRDYEIDWAGCVGTDCYKNQQFRDEFYIAANAMRASIKRLHDQKVQLFNSNEHRLEKLSVLLADRLRQDIRYPMDIHQTDQNDFLLAYFADHVHYLLNDSTPAQPDLGNYSRSDFSHIVPTDVIIQLRSKRHFRAAGVYALPGQIFSVTRTDNSEVNTRISISSVNHSSTKVFDPKGYIRPKFIASHKVTIKPGETIQITSAYGGPVQVSFDANDQPVHLEFQNIGLHPYWKGSDDNVEFAARLDAAEYDWAELSTAGFEVHSKADLMLHSINEFADGDPVKFAKDTLRNEHNLAHALAGFQGPDIDVIDEVHDFANERDWAIHNIDIVKHMNADMATCGSGCSGNPYDAFWAFNPVGHGDLHEVGHGLQGRMRFVGWESHSMTNLYSYYAKSEWNKTEPTKTQCQNLNFGKAFDVLQASANAADPASYMQANYWQGSAWHDQVVMFIQMLMSAQHAGAVENGWHIRARLHIMEREWHNAKRTDDTWEAKKNSLGMQGYSQAEANNMGWNEFILIAMSVVTQRDYRDYLLKWGIPFTKKSLDQVGSLGLRPVELVYFVSSGTQYCQANANDLTKAKLPLDGVAAWPDSDNEDDYVAAKGSSDNN